MGGRHKMGVRARAEEEASHYPIAGEGWVVSWGSEHDQVARNSDNYPVVSGTYMLMKIEECSPYIFLNPGR